MAPATEAIGGGGGMQACAHPLLPWSGKQLGHTTCIVSAGAILSQLQDPVRPLASKVRKPTEGSAVLSLRLSWAKASIFQISPLPRICSMALGKFCLQYRIGNTNTYSMWLQTPDHGPDPVPPISFPGMSRGLCSAGDGVKDPYYKSQESSRQDSQSLPSQRTMCLAFHVCVVGSEDPWEL